MRLIRLFFILFFFLCSILLSALIIPNLIMYLDSKNKKPIHPKEYAIVLGASVHGEALSGALRTRMEKAVQLYHKKLVKNILLSGDGTDPNYNETSAMKKYALRHHIPEDALITDEKGYNTYASLFRAKQVFNTKSAYIISQQFHLRRAVWIARTLGIDAEGVSTSNTKELYYYDLREFFARSKDFYLVLLKVQPYNER